MLKYTPRPFDQNADECMHMKPNKLSICGQVQNYQIN